MEAERGGFGLLVFVGDVGIVICLFLLENFINNLNLKQATESYTKKKRFALEGIEG